MSGKAEIDKGLYLLEWKLGWILSGRTNINQKTKLRNDSLYNDNEQNSESNQQQSN